MGAEAPRADRGQQRLRDGGAWPAAAAVGTVRTVRAVRSVTAVPAVRAVTGFESGQALPRALPRRSASRPLPLSPLEPGSFPPSPPHVSGSVLFPSE